MCQHLLKYQFPQLKTIACRQKTNTQPRGCNAHSVVNHPYYLKTSSPSPRLIYLKTIIVRIIEEQQCDTQESRYGISSATTTMHVRRLHYPNKLATSQCALTKKKSQCTYIRHHICNHGENHNTLILRMKFQLMYAEYHRLVLIFLPRSSDRSARITIGLLFSL